MEYSNPKIPEGINVTDEYPLKDFFAMLAGVSLTVAVILALLMFLAERLVVFIPFDVELKLASNLQQLSVSEINPQQKRAEDYLQGLAEQLVRDEELPEVMKISVHYSDSWEINAFATLGGNIVICRGLIEKLDSENSLAMVIAHEIAHIKHRDPIVALGRGVTLGLVAMSLMGSGDGVVAQKLVGQIGLLTSLTFSRDQEADADEEALFALQRHYGHVGGAEKIFEVFIEEQESLQPPEMLSTHPLSKERLEKINGFVLRHGDSSFEEQVELPDWLTGS